jgi:hypothetical protein
MRADGIAHTDGDWHGNCNGDGYGNPHSYSYAETHAYTEGCANPKTPPHTTAKTVEIFATSTILTCLAVASYEAGSLVIGAFLGRLARSGAPYPQTRTRGY